MSGCASRHFSCKTAETWVEAFSFIRGLNRTEFQGYSDWKLPNRRELFSLISHDRINPCLPPSHPSHPFINVFTGYYWTATSCTRLPDQAGYIHLGGARVFLGLKRNAYMVWPVRVPQGTATNLLQTGQQVCYGADGTIIACADTGQDGEFQAGSSGGSPRFTEDGQLVRDHATGLIWLKNANINGDALDWESALAFVEDMNRESRYGYADWRLPDIVEMESITDMGRHSPALPADHPFDYIQEFYWSCTTSKYNTGYAWALYMRDGTLTPIVARPERAILMLVPAGEPVDAVIRSLVPHLQPAMSSSTAEMDLGS
jgi:hypothetical protein